MKLTGAWGFARSYLELTNVCFDADFQAIFCYALVTCVS